MANPNQHARNGNGRYHRTPETIARDIEAARLYYEEHLSYREIAKHFGWTCHSSAMDAVHRAMTAAAEPAKGIRERRERELQFLWDSAMEIYNKDHIVVSHGRVAERNGEPIPDDGPRLQALEQLRKINVEWRKLHGSDAALKVDATVTEITQQDIELQEMVAEMRAKNADVEERLRNAREHPQ